MAADTILEPMDYTPPVLDVITKGRSFYNAQFYITTFSSGQYITKYIANGLPTWQEDGMLRSLTIPNSFVADGSSHTNLAKTRHRPNMYALMLSWDKIFLN